MRRAVRAAMAASVVITSGTGAGELRRSESQMESMALASQKSINCHRNAAPRGPAGHGPGMMPMRYLISMGRMVRAGSTVVKRVGVSVVGTHK